MKFAVIAAGEGSRLKAEGVECPKPLLPINGEPMIDRLCKIFVKNGATEIVIIVNQHSRIVREHLERLALPVPLRIVQQTTLSSLHSLYALSPYLYGEPFCLTTVDTVFQEMEFSKYVHRCMATRADGCMAVTPFVDDEKPLYVATDGEDLITGFHDSPEPGDHYVSGGVYYLKDRALQVLAGCVRQGMTRMRNFQRQLVEEGLRLEAFPFAKIVDVDHPKDIHEAESLLEVRESPFIYVTGVSRGSRYSPNLVSSDAAIMEAVSRRLSVQGCIVTVYSETYFLENRMTDGLIFHMARDPNTIRRLQQLEREGALVVNSAFGIANCVRLRMTEILIDSGIPHPRSWIVRQGEELPADITYPCWMKRGDSCAVVKEDVSYVKDREAAERVWHSFQQRGICTLVINEHLCGDLVKFYGVLDTDFFYWFYPLAETHTKFGLEVINGTPKGFPFSVEELKRYADKAAQALNVPIYGGDCIVAEDGKMKIFDFNDWPSFSPCRERAAEKIAEYIMKQIKGHLNNEKKQLAEE